MPKNLLQDVKIKSGGVRGIRQIPKEPPKELPQETFRKEIPKEVRRADKMEIPRYDSLEEFGQPSGRIPGRRSKYSIWIVAVICIIFFLFALSFLFGRAEVTVNPKMQELTLNENLSAIKDSNSGGVSFDLVVISGEDSKKVPAGDAKDVALKATGAVFIYNTFSSAPQKLNIDTRLEGSNGKIYKTTTALTVPGVNSDGTPGKVQANIYGEVAGAEYNSNPLDFKIFGFKGTPKYEKFYARSTGAITGGFVGKSAVVSDAEKESTLSELRVALKAKLLKQASDQIPEGFILFQDSVFLDVTEENVGFTSESSDLPITVKGTLYGFLFNEENLTKKIAQDNIEGYDDSDVYIPNIRDLTFSLANKDISFSAASNISFNLSGPAKIVWKFDSGKLTAELLDKSKKDFNQILSQYPNVESADLALSPFWARTLPSKSKDIKITVNYPE